MSAGTTANDVVAQVRAELGAFGEKQAEVMKAQAARIEEIDARMAELKGTAGEEAKRRYFGALASGTPHVFDAASASDPAAAVDGYVGRGAVTPAARRGLLGVRQARALMSAVASGRTPSPEAAIDVARGWGDDQLAGIIEETRDHQRNLGGTDERKKALATRALGTQVLGNGAAFISPQYADFIIEALIGNAVVRGFGVTELPMPGGQLGMPFLSEALTARYVEENRGSDATKPQDGRLNLVRRTLQAVVAMSKELVRESSYNVDAFLRQHLGQVFAAREDLAFIRGDGTDNTPRGMRSWAQGATTGGEAHVFNRNSTVNVINITNDLLKAMRLPDQAKVPRMNPGWILDVVTAYGLMAKRNPTTEQEIWPELRAGTLYGVPFKISNQIPTNLAGDGAGTGTNNKSEVYFACFGNLVIAETQGLEINAYDGGAYRDGAGVLQSAISNREVVLEAAKHHDFGDFYRGKSISVVESVDWGR